MGRTARWGAVATLAGCAACSPWSNNHSYGIVAERPEAAKLCPGRSYLHEGHTQSREHRGGCLENFQHFYAMDGDMPLDRLPDVVIGYHWEYGNMEVRLKPDPIMVPIKDDAGNRITSMQTYHVSARVGGGDLYLDLCTGQTQPVGGERGTAMAVPGFWTFKQSKYQESIDSADQKRKAFTLACISRGEPRGAPRAPTHQWDNTAGAAAKCVQWGYAPWASYLSRKFKTNINLGRHFHACVGMARSRYDPSTGAAFTCTGASIEFIDSLGLRTRRPRDGRYVVEAGWGEGRPTCVTTPRYPACKGEPAVTKFGECKFPLNDIDQWPEDVLFVNWSRPEENRAPTDASKCPNQYGACG